MQQIVVQLIEGVLGSKNYAANVHKIGYKNFTATKRFIGLERGHKLFLD